MKKTLIVILLLALTLSACRAPKGYEITNNGQVTFLDVETHGLCKLSPGEMDKVFIHCYRSGFTAAVDSAVVIYE